MPLEKMSGETKGFPKWQVALAVGAGAVAVVGVSALAYLALRGGRKQPETPRPAPSSRDTDDEGAPEVRSEETDTAKVSLC